MAVIMITHDLGVVAGMADRICVMYGGRIVEEGPTEAVFEDPRMPYTIGLLGSIPRLDRPDERRLTPIRGVPPEPLGEARVLPLRAALRLRAPSLPDVRAAGPARSGEGQARRLPFRHPRRLQAPRDEARARA